jgi:two-component system LytT family response regulator
MVRARAALVRRRAGQPVVHPEARPMERIRTAICDDEPDAREGLRELVRVDPDIEVVGEARDGAEAVSLFEAARPELVFLDIQMPHLDGFGALGVMARTIAPEHQPVVVFVTAYDAYALRAFEVHALDYLLKPFSDARFAETLRVAKDRVRQRRAGVLGRQLASLLLDGQPAAAPPPDRLPAAPDDVRPSSSSRYLERLQVRVAQKVYFVPVADIDWIEADDYYAKLHVGGRSYLLRETLSQLATELDPQHFVRVHRSAIVNIQRVKLLQPYFGGAHVITLRDGTQVPLSRSRRDDFERALGSRL